MRLWDRKWHATLVYNALCIIPSTIKMTNPWPYLWCSLHSLVHVTSVLHRELIVCAHTRVILNLHFIIIF